MKITTVAVLLFAGTAWAQPLPEVVAPDAAAEAEAPGPPAWCADRGPLSIVAAYDAGKHFRKVEAQARAATDDLVTTLCPGDQVRLASFGTTVDWVGPAVVLGEPDSAARVAKLLLHRKRPNDMNSVNDSLVKTALSYWERGGLREGDTPALFVFTDSIASDAPKRGAVMDFPWNELPTWLHGRFLLMVSLLEPGSRPRISVTAQPEAWKDVKFPSGPGVTYSKVMEAWQPEPEPPVRIVERVVRVDQTTHAAPWLLWFGTLPGVATVAGGVVALMLLFYFIGRGRRRKPVKAGAKAHPPREVTLVLWDRLHKEVLREETRTLEETLRIGPTSDADFVVPGPYALDLVNGNGEGASVRSANMLGLEMHRAGGRTLTLAEGEASPLHTGDRVDLGGGHEIEVRIH